jgi:hypothetical protein
MSGNEIRILRYLWAGLRLTDKAVTAPNGREVQRVRYQTLMDLLRAGYVEADPQRPNHYRLTTEGRARALVKVRVEDFIDSLAANPHHTQP